MTVMYKFLRIFLIGIMATAPCIAATRTATTRAAQTNAAARMATPDTGYKYNYMYPYLNNQMRTELNPGITTSQSLNPINAVVKTENMGGARRVVSRAATAGATTSATARSATRGVASSAARSATQTTAARAAAPQASSRRVVARSAKPQGGAVRATGRGDASASTQRVNNITDPLDTTATNISATRCMADYTECMNGYCQRENTKYNKCYCSAKLSQIDAQYQPTIDSLIKQILTMRNKNQWSTGEFNEYWMSTIGKYTGDNSWTNIDNALDIDWAGLESRVRGQQAFATGHEYCVQHLRGCYYMAANLRDAYRSEIARDCATYEQSLIRLKNAAESIIEANK